MKDVNEAPKTQNPFTRAALRTCGRTKSKFLSVYLVLIATGFACVFEPLAFGQIGICPVTTQVPAGSPVATLLFDARINECYAYNGDPNFPCCPAAASIDLPAGSYIATLNGDVYSTEGYGGPAGLPIAWGSGSCPSHSSANCCILIDPRDPRGGPILIHHPGGSVYVWRNDNYWGDNYGVATVNFYVAGSQPPVAKCKDVTVTADSNGSAGASVDDGSFDPDGGPITLTQLPPGPYPAGTTPVTLTVTDSQGLSSTCVAMVTVQNQPPNPTIFVANQATDSISVISGATDSVIATIPVGIRPMHVEISPDGRRAYVSNHGSDTVSVIDVSSLAVIATIPVGHTPYGLAASPDNLKVYVTHTSSEYTGFVWAIDVSSLTASSAFSLPNQVGAAPTATFHPSASEMWIRTGNGGYTRRVSYPDHTVLGDLPIETVGGGSSDNHFSFVPGTEILYAADSCGCCGHFDRSRYSPAITWVGRRHEDGQGAARWTVAAPSGGIAYLARHTHCTTPTTVIRKESAISDSTLAVSTIPGFYSWVGAVTPNGARLYCTATDPSGATPTVLVVDTASMNLVATIPVGSQPLGIAISPLDITQNRAPTAKCKDVTVFADSSGTADASVDDGSFDPDGDPVTVTQSPAGPYPLGTTAVTLTVTDDKGASSTCADVVTVQDTTPPFITCRTHMQVNADPLRCSAVVSGIGPVAAGDNCTGYAVAYVLSGATQATGVGDASGTVFNLGKTTVTYTITDVVGLSASCSFDMTVVNPSPAVTLIGPASGSLFAVNTPVTFNGSFSDAGGGMHTAAWQFDGLSPSSANVTLTEPDVATLGSTTASYAFSAAGVYRVKLTIADSCGGAGMADQIDGMEMLVVVYDPSAGFVTGGGWILSQPGAYVADPMLTGRANFGFVSKYQKGATVPTGQTEFIFKMAGLNFHSLTYQWLVVAGAKAQYKGTGQVNGAGNYGFLLTAVDGEKSGGGVDKFRIKIWDSNNGDAIVYDNGLGASDDIDDAKPQALGGGSIVIHN